MSLLTKQQATLDKFLKENHYKALATREKYTRFLRRLARTIPKPFEDMDNDDLTEFLNGLVDLKVHSRNTIRQVLKFFFKWLGWKQDDFGLAMKYEKVPRKRLNIPTIEDLEQLVEAAGEGKHGVRDRALVGMLVYGGMRVGAVCEFPPNSWDSGQGFMTYEDVELTPERIIEIHIRHTKTREERTVYIVDPNGIANIQQWRNQHPTKKPNDPFFCTFHHDSWQPLSYNTVLRIVRQAGKHAGLKLGRDGIHPHKLRKAWASHKEEKGVSRGLIENQGGWKPNSPVLREYVELNPSKVKEQILEYSGISPAEKPKPKLTGRVECRLCGNTVPKRYPFCMHCGAPTDEKGAEMLLKEKTERRKISLQLSELEERSERKFKELEDLFNAEELIQEQKLSQRLSKESIKWSKAVVAKAGEKLTIKDVDEYFITYWKLVELGEMEINEAPGFKVLKQIFDYFEKSKKD